MSMIRTFIAVDSTAAVQEAARRLVESLRASGVKATWTKPENMHLTLKFLGDTPAERIPVVRDAVAETARRFAPLTLRFCGAGAFPTARRPRTVWLGVADGQAEIVALANAIDTALGKLGFPKEKRAFQPHLTLGRIRDERGAGLPALSGLLSENSQYEAGTARIDEVLVFASHLAPAGATYEILGRAALVP